MNCCLSVVLWWLKCVLLSTSILPWSEICIHPPGEIVGHTLPFQKDSLPLAVGRLTAAGEAWLCTARWVRSCGLWGEAAGQPRCLPCCHGDDLGFARLPRITAMSPARSTQLSSLLPLSKSAGKVSFPGKLLEM